MTTGPDPVRVAAEVIVSWLNGLGIDDAQAELVEDAYAGFVYVVTSRQAPHRWPLQIGSAELRGELEWPDGAELNVMNGQQCRVREGEAVLPLPFDNDHNEAWWEELGQPWRPRVPRLAPGDREVAEDRATQVLVHNASYRSREDADEASGVVEDWTWWNLWKTRQQPYQELKDGIRVLLLQSWPGGGRLSHLVRARDVLKQHCSTWEDAVATLVGWSGLSEADVRNEPYTAARKGDGPLHLIAWRAEELLELDLPRPAGLALRRNGWAVLSVDELTALGLGDVLIADEPAVDARRQRAVELHAVALALAWCVEQRWEDARHVGDDGFAWDVEAVDQRGRTRYVEVKGTTGPGQRLNVTRNEVEAAVDHGDLHALVHVRDIYVVRDEGGWTCSDGDLIAYDPWRPRDAELQAEVFSWTRLPAGAPAEDEERRLVRLPGYGGAALTLAGRLAGEGWQDLDTTGPVVDVGLIDPSRHVRYLARPCSTDALSRLADFLLAAAGEHHPEATVPSYQDLTLGLSLSVVQSDSSSIELDVIVAESPGEDLLDPDAMNFRTSRAAAVAAAQQAAELAAGSA